jgi:hypothetical protein
VIAGSVGNGELSELLATAWLGLPGSHHNGVLSPSDPQKGREGKAGHDFDRDHDLHTPATTHAPAMPDLGPYRIAGAGLA